MCCIKLISQSDANFQQKIDLEKMSKRALDTPQIPILSKHFSLNLPKTTITVFKNINSCFPAQRLWSEDLFLGAIPDISLQLYISCIAGEYAKVGLRPYPYDPSAVPGKCRTKPAHTPSWERRPYTANR